MNGNGYLPTEALLERATSPVYGDEAIELIRGHTVLVTGAGGSIGSEIVRQLQHLGAGKIVCVDNNEYALYLLERELTGTALLVDETMVLADIRNPRALNAIMAKHQPDIVFHAAACKHLPLLERSPDMAVLTNVLGTHNVAEACVQHGVKRLVNVSTDKAANPISVLGMSKRLAEIVVRAHAGQGTQVASVRFGNVFASRGSFVETFVWQMDNDQPVTVTDEGMTRYFMTIPQAAGLVIEAAVMADAGSTFVLNMGASYNILDLIYRYAEMINAEPNIVFTGKRQGEKLDEVLFDPTETRKPTVHPAISTVMVDDAIPLEDILGLCISAAEVGTDNPAAEIRDLLTTLMTNHPSAPMILET